VTARPRNRGLDGLRAILVLMVMAFHWRGRSGEAIFSAGWLGVQGFFVLSGYLITGNLEELQRQRSLPSYLRTFYYRRTLRIFPLYYAYLVALAIAHWLAGEPALFPRYALSLFTFTYNFARIGPWTPSPYFTHFWSLALEEQFYLVWPLVLFLVPKNHLRAALIACLALTPAVRMMIGAYLGGRPNHTPVDAGDALYWLLPCQIDAFAAGAAIVIFDLGALSNAMVYFLLSLFAVSKITGIAHPGLLYNTQLEHVWGFSAANACFAFLIIVIVQRHPAIRFLESSLFVSLGVVSYGMYVLHFAFIDSLFRVLGATLVDFAPFWFPIWVVVIALVAKTSFVLLESPFLRLKDRRPAPALSREAAG
jgi:peptidoglycan/LPS O-acetylase OafA/YrhL